MAIKRIAYERMNKPTTITEIFEEFYTEYEVLGKAKSTLRNYKQSFGYYMEFCGFDDKTPIDEICKQNVMLWINVMKRAGDKSIHTINHYLRDLRAFLYWCMNEERKYIKEPFKIKEVGHQKAAPKAFELDDIEILLEEPTSDSFGDWRTWIIVGWIMATGNRSNTVCNVQIGDVDFNNKQIYLREVKNKEYAFLPLSTALASSLKRFMHDFGGYFDTASKSDYLFPNSNGKQLTTNALRHSFSRYCKVRRVERTNLHGLRHSFAINYLRNGGTMEALQHILGHTTLEMTKRYVRMNVEDLKKNYDKFSPLDNIIKNKPKRSKPDSSSGRIKRNK